MSRASKRRAKKARKRGSVATMAKQWEVQQATPSQPQEDARATVLSARCRQMGIADNRANRRAMTWEGFGDPAGMALHIGATDEAERNDLWDTFKRIDAAEDAYARRYIGIRRFPNVGKVEFLPERFETSADDALDTRTDAEKDRDAVSGWMRWQGYLGHLHAAHHQAILAAMRRRVELTTDGKLRGAGTLFVEGMRRLRKVEQGC